MPTLWPSPGDYSTAIQNPQNCFSEPDLKRGTPSKNTLGLPVGASGNFAVVYQMKTTSGAYAVRCFIRPVTDQEQRYQALSNYFRDFSLPCLVEFSYHETGIKIQGREYPVVRMAWVPGDQLHSYIESHLRDAKALSRLASRWRGLVAGLRGANSAHGDLQHGNILVDSAGELRLVDYDGFFIPALNGCPPGEVGQPNYQHPERIEYGKYDQDVDNFSAIVIYLSITALSCDEGLWRFHSGDNLVFSADDFKQPGQTDVWKQISRIRNNEVHDLTRTFEEICRGPIAKVPDLESVLQHKGAQTQPSGGKQNGPASASPASSSLVQRIEELRSLIALALVDDVFTFDEERMIREKGTLLQLSEDDVLKVINQEVRKHPGLRRATSIPSGIAGQSHVRGSLPTLKFRKGEAATLQDLVVLCDRYVDEAQQYLFNGDIAHWLSLTGAAAMAQTARTIISVRNLSRRQALEMLIRAVAQSAGMSAMPQLTASVSKINLGKAPVGYRNSTLINLKNQGRGYAWGKITLQPNIPGLSTRSGFEGSDSRIEIAIDLSATKPGSYISALVVEPEGVPSPLRIPVELEVVPLSIQISPRRCELGGLTFGTKSSVELQLTNTISGGRIQGRAVVTPGHPGVSCPANFDGEGPLLIVDVDTAQMESGKEYRFDVLLNTNAGNFSVPIEFSTTIPWRLVWGWGLGIAAIGGTAFGVFRAIVASVQGNNGTWLASYSVASPSLLFFSGSLSCIVAVVLGGLIYNRRKRKKG